MKMMTVLLLLISQDASGVEVRVYEGVESVLLPCQVPDNVSRSSTSAVWDRNGFSNPTVHMRLRSRDDHSKQNPRYTNRTSMRDDALTTGDLSLTLRNPTVFDSGTYNCTALNAGHAQNWTEVQLKVKETPPVWPKVLSAVLGTLIILAAAFGLFVYRAYRRMKNREALQPEVVEVPQGEESVLLPFKTMAYLPQDVTVEWRLTEPKHMKVHVYESGNNQPDKQDQGYRGRTEMDEDPLRTKDLSLTLKHLHLTDSGVYTCTVYNKDGHMLLQKSVILSVRVNKVEAVEVTKGEESVLLPFKFPADLPQDVTVEWTHNNMKVHVYETGNNQPDKQDQGYRGRTEMDEDPLRNKDFSLTLKHLHLTDSGVYTCTVYNKEGHMLLQKSVILSVREYEKAMVTEGTESVQLPFKITADLRQDVKVEWNYKKMKVHVYKSGKNQLGKQHQGYIGRTEMKEDPLRTKDLSLTLKYPHLTDSGVYTCTVYGKDRHTLLQKSVTLCVTVEKHIVTQGEESVLLPFKTTAVLPQDVTVEWRLTEPKHMKVHVYETGNNQPVKQDQGYRGRTEMDEDPLRTKDLSLTLKHLHLTDSGVYTCTVYNKDGHTLLLQKSVILSVRDVGMEMVVTQGLKFVMLPFIIPHDLPRGTTVKWRHNNVTVYRCIHVNVNSQYQDYRGRTEMNNGALTTGDLSLTLKDLHLTDSGVYTCTVYNKDGHMLLQKSVRLSVRDNEVNMVEVTQAKETVLLPFKTTADLPQDVTVEWTRSGTKHAKVYVFQKRKSQVEEQDQVYRGRTEMKEDPLRTKDLSLTLKDLHLTDSGVYTCTVYNKDGHMLLQKSVTLTVTETLMGAMADMLPRLRRRRRAPEELRKM
ncbi:vascular endothelial growth factor receptor 1-like [Oreochromis aureus]|uniref:vascular endothelial growth factor receptor 1-like n=1 Tax=Oreochromis aureus TaxID=47969 RepID=UPI001952BDC1|nr:vascular endothelial growth factor receptor 1-like [Oreochromis aureus]